MQEIKSALTIAGLDPSGGAGIVADLKTFSAFGVYGMSAITALTVQNSMGVSNVLDVPASFLEEQLIKLFDDMKIDSVKIGMLVNKDIIESISKVLEKYKAKNVVVDTILLSTSGYPFLEEKAKQALIDKLFPLSDIITPNILEAKFLNGINIASRKDAEKSARAFKDMGLKNVLIKGGHFEDMADDLLMMGDEYIWLPSKRLDSNSTHGTGCTLSSAISSNLALGKDLKTSVEIAKTYVFNAIKNGFDLGNGIGQLNHFIK